MRQLTRPARACVRPPASAATALTAMFVPAAAAVLPDANRTAGSRRLPSTSPTIDPRKPATNAPAKATASSQASTTAPESRRWRPGRGCTGGRRAGSGTRARPGWLRAPRRAQVERRSARRQIARATWRRAAASVPPGRTKLFSGSSVSLTWSHSSSSRSTCPGVTRRRSRSSSSGTERSAPRSKRSFCTCSSQGRNSAGRSPASTKPRTELSSSTVPYASIR